MIGAAILLMTLSLSANSWGQAPKPPATAPNPQVPPEPKLHTLTEILQIMEASPLLYDYGSVPDSVAEKDDSSRRPVLRDKQYVKVVNGRPALVEYTITPEVQQQLDLLNESNQAKNYAMSLGFSRKMLELDSTFNYARTLIGDAFYLLEQYDSAIYWLRSSITHNYADYEAHWFLADALLASHDTTGAIRELTLAHVLNVNASLLEQSLTEYRKLKGRTFGEWEFRPHVKLEKKADTVFVRYDAKSEGYALVKAVWAYEPGYSEKMLGRKPDQVSFRMLEEREAVGCDRETDTALNRRLERIERAGYFDEFLLYEIAARRYPEWIPTMPHELIRRIAEYVDKFR
ncbi:hypothetical protein C3F09_03940 [candidate division GN15 bacterium]|uniref:Tetratricopeptide repeat protein n=1 Tax=candidate division GN15 bacterium TaxID=2072418 RepID=A0A855X8H2_9BACT|nr:MAG: hypothetical protein C3F09_03940 [candidate division GN15 bacterium]